MRAVNERSFIEALRQSPLLALQIGIGGSHDLQTERPSSASSARISDGQALTSRRSDDSRCRSPHIEAEIPHATSQPIIPELPEAHGVTAPIDSARIPPALPPGVGEAPAHPTVTPARSPELRLGIARCIHPLPGGTEGSAHGDRGRAGSRGEGRLGRNACGEERADEQRGR